MATSWNEIEQKDLVWIVPFLFDHIQGLPMQIGAYSILTGLNLKTLDPTIAKDIIPYSAFISTPCEHFIIKKIWPTVLKSYHLPSEKFKNLTVLEYITYQQNLGVFLNPKSSSDEKEMALATILSHLCRPKNKRTKNVNYDLREAYDQQICDQRIPFIRKKINWLLQLAILWQFMQADGFIKRKYEPIFPKPSSTSESNKPNLPSGKSVLNMVLSIAEQGIFGS